MAAFALQGKESFKHCIGRPDTTPAAATTEYLERRASQGPCRLLRDVICRVTRLEECDGSGVQNDARLGPWA